MSPLTARALVAFAAVVAAVACGAHDAALHVLPLLVLGALLLNGRFVGEQRILSIRRTRIGHKLRTALVLGWTARDRITKPLRVERSPRSLRGPPTLA